MEFKKIEFQIDDKTYTIASIEDFIDVELAGMNEDKLNFESTPFITYFRNELVKLTQRLEDGLKKQLIGEIQECQNQIKSLLEMVAELEKNISYYECNKNYFHQKSVDTESRIRLYVQKDDFDILTLRQYCSSMDSLESKKEKFKLFYRSFRGRYFQYIKMYSNDFKEGKIPVLFGKYYYKITNCPQIVDIMFSLSSMTDLSNFYAYAISGRNEVIIQIPEIYNGFYMKPRYLLSEYISSFNSPTIDKDEKEFIKDLAYKIRCEGIKFTNLFIANESTSMWCDIKISDVEELLVMYLCRIEYNIYFSSYDFDSTKTDKDHLLMFDYAKAYLLYDLILSNRIEFLDDIPPFVEEIRQKGRVRALKQETKKPIEQPDEE